MFEIELAFSANDYEHDLRDDLRLYADQTLPGPEPPNDKIRMFRSSFGAAFALATAVTLILIRPRRASAMIRS